MYEIGLGIPRDAKKAIDLYKKAADQNVVAAEARLGDIYLSGDQVPPDFGQAKYYLDRAAYHGDPRSAMLLGQMYRVGLGIQKDLKQAYA
jgi:TPR repeat protein